VPGASLHSVLITIAESATLFCWVSSSTALKAVFARPAYNHCDSGRAWAPIRVSGGPSRRSRATTHTLLYCSDTSVPT
jgi:hypothetical protein